MTTFKPSLMHVLAGVSGLWHSPNQSEPQNFKNRQSSTEDSYYLWSSCLRSALPALQREEGRWGKRGLVGEWVEGKVGTQCAFLFSFGRTVLVWVVKETVGLETFQLHQAYLFPAFYSFYVLLSRLCLQANWGPLESQTLRLPDNQNEIRGSHPRS